MGGIGQEGWCGPVDECQAKASGCAVTPVSGPWRGVPPSAVSRTTAGTGALAGQRLVVNYTLDEFGLIKDVWVLTPAERAREPWPRTPEQAARWRFDPLGQSWTKP